MSFKNICIGTDQWGSKYGINNKKKIPYEEIEKIFKTCIKYNIN